MDSQKGRTFGATFVLLQGLVTALAPQASLSVIKNMIGKNFENASDLEAKPAYVRQLRGLGVGLVAAAGTNLLLQSVADADGDPVEASQSESD
jgi:hypothetical protein